MSDCKSALQQPLHTEGDASIIVQKRFLDLEAHPRLRLGRRGIYLGRVPQCRRKRIMRRNTGSRLPRCQRSKEGGSYRTAVHSDYLPSRLLCRSAALRISPSVVYFRHCCMISHFALLLEALPTVICSPEIGTELPILSVTQLPSVILATHPEEAAQMFLQWPCR